MNRFDEAAANHAAHAAAKAERRAVRKLSDREALDRIHRMLDGRVWSSAADYLESIAEIVRETGREIRPPR